MKWRPVEAEAGDMVRIRIGSIYHYGVFVSENEVIQFGLPPREISRNWDSVKVLSTDAETFSAGSIVEVACLDRGETKKRIPKKKTVEIARSRIGEGGYNLIHNNCEHFANECVFGVKYSEQESQAMERWLSRPVFDIYIMRIPEDGKVGEIRNPARKKDVGSVKNEKLKLEKYYAWELLGRALKKSAEIDIDTVNFQKKRNGQWTADGFFFSVSHSGGFVCCAYSNAPCGVDIETLESFERHSDNLTELYGKIALDSEKTEPVNADALLTLWTKKESVFKALGGKTFAPKKINTADYFTDTAVFNGNIFVSAASEKTEAKYFRYYFADEEIHQILKSEIKDTII